MPAESPTPRNRGDSTVTGQPECGKPRVSSKPEGEVRGLDRLSRSPFHQIVQRGQRHDVTGPIVVAGGYLHRVGTVGVAGGAWRPPTWTKGSSR